MVTQPGGSPPCASTWILQALAYAAKPGSPVRLEHLVAAADYLNHALPTYAEAVGAIQFFMAQGWVDADVDGPRLTGVAVQVVDTIVRPGCSTRKEYLELEAFLLAHPATEDRFPEPAFTAADWQAACESYLRRHQIKPGSGQR